MNQQPPSKSQRFRFVACACRFRSCVCVKATSDLWMTSVPFLGTIYDHFYGSWFPYAPSKTSRFPKSQDSLKPPNDLFGFCTYDIIKCCHIWMLWMTKVIKFQAKTMIFQVFSLPSKAKTGHIWLKQYVRVKMIVEYQAKHQQEFSGKYCSLSMTYTKQVKCQLELYTSCCLLGNLSTVAHLHCHTYTHMQNTLKVGRLIRTFMNVNKEKHLTSALLSNCKLCTAQSSENTDCTEPSWVKTPKCKTVRGRE